MTQSSKSSRKEVILSSPSIPILNKQISPAKCWCFTLNNYTDNEILQIQSSIDAHCKIGFFGKEVGENGTPHLQGYIEFLFKARPLSKFPIARAHWEKAKGNTDINFKYCSKDCALNEEMAYCKGIKKKKPLKIVTDLKPWQTKVKELIDLEHANDDDRTINWVIDNEGCAGKTVFCKWLSVYEKQFMVITGGGYKDIACCLAQKVEKDGYDLNDRTTIMFNIPRDADDQGMISYKALESLKDGMMTSPKYETTTMIFNCPVVWIFSNNEPEVHKLTEDRWKIWKIKKNNLIRNYDHLFPEN